MYSEALRRKDLRSQHGRTQHQGRWDEHDDENPNILSLHQASEKWAKIQVVVAINDHTYRSLWYAYAFFLTIAIKIVWICTSSEFFNDFFSPFRLPFFGTQMCPKCEFRFLPPVTTFVAIGSSLVDRSLHGCFQGHGAPNPLRDQSELHGRSIRRLWLPHVRRWKGSAASKGF